MSLFRPKTLYDWSEEARAEVYVLAENWASRPGVRLSLELRRPTVWVNRLLVVAAHDDGLAFRLGDMTGPGVLRRPASLNGFTLIPGGLRERWAEAFDQAYALATHQD